MKKLLFLICLVPHSASAMNRYEACKENDVAYLEKLMQEDPEIVTRPFTTNEYKHAPSNYFPIHAAAYYFSSEVLEFILKKDASRVNKKAERYTPMGLLTVKVGLIQMPFQINGETISYIPSTSELDEALTKKLECAQKCINMLILHGADEQEAREALRQVTREYDEDKLTAMIAALKNNQLDKQSE